MCIRDRIRVFCYVRVDRHIASVSNWPVGIDPYNCKPITWTNRYRSTVLTRYIDWTLADSGYRSYYIGVQDNCRRPPSQSCRWYNRPSWQLLQPCCYVQYLVIHPGRTHCAPQSGSIVTIPHLFLAQHLQGDATRGAGMSVLSNDSSIIPLM